MAKLLSIISRGLVIWVVLGAAVAYVRPNAFVWTGFSLFGQPLFMWMFTLTMFSVGTVIDPKRFVFLTRHPLSVVLGLATQFTVMPAAAFLISRLAGFEDDVTLGFIIVGCAPGAMTSNVLTYLARGDTAFSVTLTTLASILAVGLTPTLVKLLAGAEMGITADEFWSQLWTIAWTVAIPLVGGLALRVALPKGKRLYETFSPAVAVLAIVIICCFVIQKNHEHLAQSTGGIAMAVIAVNGLGFGLGNLLGRLYRLTPAQRITLTIEIGMQNAGMGVVLAVTTFKDQPRVAIPSAFFTIWCIVTAAALIAFLKKHRSEP